MINSRKLTDLRPDTEAKCRTFIEACEQRGIDVIITSTLRDVEAQNALYAQGRSRPGNIVTKVPGGRSYHNWGVAFDFVPCVNGKAVWDDMDLWARCGAIGVEVGLEWGGHWEGFKDRPHFQNTGGYKVDDYMSGTV